VSYYEHTLQTSNIFALSIKANASSYLPRMFDTFAFRICAIGGRLNISVLSKCYGVICITQQENIRISKKIKKIIDYEDHPKDDFISRESYISSARFAKRIETFFFS
jgi:hypothetical protein